MDDSNDYEFESSPEEEYTVLESLKRTNWQVPRDMRAVVPNFRPLGSLRRLQGAIVLAQLSLNDEDPDDEGIALDDLGSIDFGFYTEQNRLKARQIASTKHVHETFSSEPFKGPSDNVVGLDDIKHEWNANDTTLEIPPVETDGEKENLPVIHNERNLEKPYAVTALKKKESITYKLNVKCEFSGSQIGLTTIAPPPPTNRRNRLEIKCSRNAVRTLNSQITQMRDPFDGVKLKKQGQLTFIKP